MYLNYVQFSILPNKQQHFIFKDKLPKGLWFDHFQLQVPALHRIINKQL